MASSNSTFKNLYSNMFNNPNYNIPNKPLKCYVWQSFPYFLVTDGYFYVQCYFTKKAIDQFHQKHNNLNITDLKHRVIRINEWTLEMNKVNSANVFTSYGGLECRLVVKGFTAEPKKDDAAALPRTPFNLFRDDEMKILIQNYNHKAVSGAVSKSNAALPDIAKFNNKANVSQGVVSFGSANYSHKEGKSVVVDLNSVFKQEKGADAWRKLQAGPAAASKAKVVGGAKRAGKAAGKRGAGAAITEKLAKYTPGDKRSAAKKSTGRILSKQAPTLQSPGGDKQAGTTDHQTMKDFRKMMSLMKKSVKGKVTGSKLGGKSSKK